MSQFFVTNLLLYTHTEEHKFVMYKYIHIAPISLETSIIIPNSMISISK